DGNPGRPEGHECEADKGGVEVTLIVVRCLLSVVRCNDNGRRTTDSGQCLRGSFMSVSHPPATHAHPELGFLRKYIFSEDHKIIGIQFLISGIIFLFVGGILALGVRVQLGWPTGTIPHIGRWFPESWGQKMSQDFYVMLFSMHATIMIFFVIIPWLTGAFGN